MTSVLVLALRRPAQQHGAWLRTARPVIGALISCAGQLSIRRQQQAADGALTTIELARAISLFIAGYIELFRQADCASRIYQENTPFLLLGAMP